MKKEVGPGAIAAIALVLVAVLAFAGYKFFGPKPSPANTPLNAKQQQMRDAMAKAASGPHVDMKSYSKDNPPPGSGGK